MREEFKFVKGLYTNKKLFDNDIINDSFVILDKNCQEVGFGAEDNSKTQSQLINASEDRVCKLYTITPDKITMKGNLEEGTEGSSYKFTPKINESIDDNETIPSDVIKTASEKLALTANYNLNVGNIGIGEGSDPASVEVTFTGINEKSFKRNMIFRATGYVDRRSLIPIGDVTGASLKNKEVYYLEDNKYERLFDINDNDVFRNGRKQEKVQVAETIFPAYEIQLRIEDRNAIADNPAHYYKAPKDYKFDCNDDVKLTPVEILESNLSSFDLIPIYSGQGALPKLTFIPPSDDNCTYLPYAIGKYIIESNTFKKIDESGKNYPYGKNQALYDNNNYYPYNGFAYQDSSTDTNEYKKLDDPTTEPISSNNVVMTNIHTAAPLFNLDKDHPYTIAIKEDTFSITATEVQSD